ncbi:MAG: tetratricopeptide repeat protein [Candidatus Omnitrophota bacterium]
MSLKKICFILACVCFLTYANSLNNQFVSDDIDSIINNEFITQPMHYWLFPSLILNCMSYFIGKLNPFVYHLTNIILHWIATVLVFLFLRFFFKFEASFLASALFAALAIHTEAVTWISGRPYIMTAIFLLTTYFLYYYATDSINPLALAHDEKSPAAFSWPGKAPSLRRGSGFKYAAYLFCLLVFLYYLWNNFPFYSLFCGLLVLSDLAFKATRKKWSWRLPLYWLPFFAITAVRLFTARSIIHARISSLATDAGAAGANWSNPLQGFLYNMVYSLSRHLGLLLWPANLTLYHEPPVISLYQLRLGIIALCFLIAGLVFIFKKSRELFFAILLFIIFLLPTFSPAMVSWLLAERYLYFPSVALCIFGAYFYEKYAGKSKRIKEGALALFLLIIAANAARAVARNQDWKTPERLWRQTVLASPYSPKAHNNMGDVYGAEGNVQGAIQEFKKAVELKSDYADGYHNLANIYHRINNLMEAEKYYKLAVTFNPLLFESYFNLGVIYLGQNELDLAVEHFKKAADLRPDDPDAQDAVAIAMQRKNEKK